MSVFAKLELHKPKNKPEWWRVTCCYRSSVTTLFYQRGLRGVYNVGKIGIYPTSVVFIVMGRKRNNLEAYVGLLPLCWSQTVTSKKRGSSCLKTYRYRRRTKLKYCPVIKLLAECSAVAGETEAEREMWRTIVKELKYSFCVLVVIVGFCFFVFGAIPVMSKREAAAPTHRKMVPVQERKESANWKIHITPLNHILDLHGFAKNEETQKPVCFCSCASAIARRLRQRGSEESSVSTCSGLWSFFFSHSQVKLSHKDRKRKRQEGQIQLSDFVTKGWGRSTCTSCRAKAHRNHTQTWEERETETDGNVGARVRVRVCVCAF